MQLTDRQSVSRLVLANVARVQAGYFSRTRVKPASDGTHRLLQARDLSDRAEIEPGTVVAFYPERNPDLYRVSEGDILIIARGQDHRAHLVQIELHDTLASSVFHIIRPDLDVVLPGYLSWWLNQPDVQAEIKAGSRGTGIGYVSRQHMEQIPVMLPACDMQKRIADTMALWRRRHTLQSQLDQKRQLMIQALCREAVRTDKDQP
ncbi:MAG: restriction endonuclease subunit S [Phycisphaeraceae bacterium]